MSRHSRRLVYAATFDAYVTDPEPLFVPLFLDHFVPDSIAWAHFDVYAWNDVGRAGRPVGGEAQGLRAVLDALSR